MVHNKLLTVLCGVLLVTPGRWPPALIGWSRSNTWTESQYQDSGFRGQEIIKHYPSPANALSFFLAVLNAQVCNLAISIRRIFPSLISFYLVLLLLLTPAHSCTHPLTGGIRQPIGRRYAEVGSASLLIPPLEWITKWKWPQGSQVHPDQLTAPSLPPSPSLPLSLFLWTSQTLPLFLRMLNPLPNPKDPHIRLSSLWLSASYSCINIRIILFHCTAQYSQRRDSISVCEIKPQDLFFILKGYSRDLVLVLYKVRGLSGDWILI